MQKYIRKHYRLMWWFYLKQNLRENVYKASENFILTHKQLRKDSESWSEVSSDWYLIVLPWDLYASSLESVYTELHQQFVWKFQGFYICRRLL